MLIFLFTLISINTARAKDQPKLIDFSSETDISQESGIKFNDTVPKWHDYVKQKLAEFKVKDKNNQEQKPIESNYELVIPGYEYVKQKLSEIEARLKNGNQDEKLKVPNFESHGPIWDKYVKEKLAQEQVGLQTHDQVETGNPFPLSNDEQDIPEYVKQKLEEQDPEYKKQNYENSGKVDAEIPRKATLNNFFEGPSKKYEIKIK